MRITKYKTKLNEDGLAYLVKEKSNNYQTDNLTSPNAIYKMLCDVYELCNETEEYVYLLCLDTKMKLLGVFEISHGSVNSSLSSSREIFQKALLCNASNIIIAHNHPSGVAEPSKADIDVALKIKEAGELMQIPLIDSLIIGNDCYYSFKENGTL